MAGPRILIVDPQAEDLRRAVAPALPDLDIRTARTRAEALREAPDAEIAASLSHTLDEELAGAFRSLKWFQAFSTGMDGVLRLKSMPKDIILTSARGAHGPQMAEMAFLHMLMLLRGGERFVHNKDRAVYDRWPQGLLFGKTIAVIGAGFIAGELAHRCKAFGMRTIGVTRTVRPIEHFDEVVATDALPRALGCADFSVILLPLDAFSKGLFDAKTIAAIKPGGFLINLGRGGIVDEAALIAALQDGSLAGAGLDVFAREPLPPDDPLWRAPNLFITPHLGGLSDVYVQQVAPILIDNLRAYLDGRPQDMINRVR